MLYRKVSRNRVVTMALFCAAAMSHASARATVLTSESFYLPSAPGSAAAAPYIDMVLNTTPATAWSEKGAVGLQGSASVNQVTGNPATPPAADVVFKFNIGAAVDALNATYGTGNWTITNPTLTFQYTYYANNSIFGGGAGSFETYWVANDAWAFGAGAAAGNSYGDFLAVTGTDPLYASSATTLLAWSGTQADLGATTYNWLSPASNPHYTSWSTDKTGNNQGLLTDTLTPASGLVNDILNASAASNPNVSLYLIPNSSSLGLTIFTGGGTVNPELSFQVVSAPEPASLAVIACGALLLLRRRP